MHERRQRSPTRSRVALFLPFALLLALGLSGTPANARCTPAGGRAGPIPAPPEDTTPPPDTPSRPPPTTPPSGGRPTRPPETPKPKERPDDGDRGETPTTPPADEGRGDPPTTPPADEPPTTPPPAPEPPTTPAPDGGTPLPMPTTGTPTRPDPTVGGTRRARPRSAAESIEWRWSTWWAFNRWNYLPSRTDVVRRNVARFHVITGEGGRKADTWGDRRDALARARATPALVRILRADLRPGDLGIKAAASLALARVSNDPHAVAAVMGALEDPRMSHEVRESAAFAAGLFRRSEPARQMEGARVDALRDRLFAVADDDTAPSKVRCLALLSVGMLGDQPRGTPLPPGVLEVRALWRRLVSSDRGAEIHIACLTALGMQPGSAAGEVVLQGLRDIALGRRFARRAWNSRERSHALCTLVRLGGERWNAALARLMSDRRITTDVRRAAFITLGERAATYGADERSDLVRTWEMAVKQARDPLTRGLGLIALGRIVGADGGDEDGGKVLRTTQAGDILLKRARNAAQNMRGFALLGLALALRGAEGDGRTVTRFRREATAQILEGFERAEGNAERRAPYVVAIGLAGILDALPALEEIVRDGNADPQLRAYAAVACGQIGRAAPTTVHALKRAVADPKLGNLRVEAALGLAYLTGDRDAKLLREDIERRRHTHSHRIGHVAIALGQMGDLRAVVPLSDLLLDDTSDHGARGAAAVALGLLCDPEKKPSQARLWEDVNYPARSAAMHTALDFY